MMKSHTDLSWVQTLPLGIIHKKSLPHCWVCKGSLILGACRVRHMDMLDLSQRGGGKWAVLFFFPPSKSSWRRQWHPTPVLLPGKSHGRRSLVGCKPWGL